MAHDDGPSIDYRFSLANERTFLAWIRTSIALLAGGIVAAKALDWNHDAWRWLVSAPPILGGAALAFDAVRRYRGYERAMVVGVPLPGRRGPAMLGGALAVYALIALAATILDG